MRGHIPPSLPPAPDDPAPSSIAARMWPRRRTWIVLGRTLGGFGAFIAALIAAAQFAFGGDEHEEKAGDSGSSTPYVFTNREDPTAAIRYEAPTEWGNVDGSVWVARTFGRVANGTPVGRKLQVSPNVAAWSQAGELTTPGVFVGVSEVLASLYTPRELAEVFSYKGCESDLSRAYRRGSLEGWEARATCPGTDASWVTLAARTTAEPSTLVFVQAKLVDERDRAALDRILATLDVTPR